MLFHEKLAQNYFQKLFERKKSVVLDDFHRLSPYEQKKIKEIKQRAVWYAGLFGALGVIFLYLPIHLNSGFFPSFDASLPWLGKTNIPWAYILYMIFLALIEIFALTWLNLVVVSSIAQVCKFPDPKDSFYDMHLLILFEASLDKTNKLQNKFGINPLEGLSPVRLFVVSMLFVLKATLSNVLLKFLLKRVFMRFALVGYVYYVDYSSILVFAGWNMYATYVVVQEAKIRIMGPTIIHEFIRHLHSILKDDVLFKEVLLEVLQSIAVAKQNYHHNHYLLAYELVRYFELPQKEKIHVEQDVLLKKMTTMSPQAQQGIAKLFILGLLIDGSISNREIYFVTELRKEGIWRITSEQLRNWAKDYMAGKGLDDFLHQELPLLQAKTTPS